MPRVEVSFLSTSVFKKLLNFDFLLVEQLLREAFFSFSFVGLKNEVVMFGSHAMNKLV